MTVTKLTSALGSDELKTVLNTLRFPLSKISAYTVLHYINLNIWIDCTIGNMQNDFNSLHYKFAHLYKRGLG